jgi:hypothetical protein
MPSVVGTVVTRLGAPPSFGRAPAHADYPEGGCQIAGETSNLDTDQVVVDDTGYGMFPDVAGTAAGRGVCPISPTGYVNLAGCTNGPMFGSAGALAVFCQYFRNFRFQELTLIYEGASPTTYQISCAVTFRPDAMDSTAILVSTLQTTAANSTTVRFPVYTNRIEVPLIHGKSVRYDDPLYFLTVANDAVTGSTSTAPTIRSLFQGCVDMRASAVNAAGALLVGNYRWKYKLDLYGFQNNLPIAITEAKLPPVETSTQRRQREAVQRCAERKGPSQLSSTVLDTVKVDLTHVNGVINGTLPVDVYSVNGTVPTTSSLPIDIQRFRGTLLTSGNTTSAGRLSLPVALDAIRVTDMETGTNIVNEIGGTAFSKIAGGTYRDAVAMTVCTGLPQDASPTITTVNLNTVGMPVDVTPQENERKVVGRSCPDELGESPVLVARPGAVTPLVTATPDGKRATVEALESLRRLQAPVLRRS